MRSRPAAALLAVVVLVTLASCDSAPDRAGPDEVADELAAGLTDKDVTEVPWRQTTGSVELDPVLGTLGDTPATVSVDKVEEDGDRATATLAWTWDLGDRDWSYTSTADLVDADGDWRVTWSPQVVEPTLRDGERLDTDVIPADRGDILGAGGQVLVTERPVVHYGLDKTRVKGAQVAASARRIAEVLGINAKDYVAEARAAGPRAFVEALVLREADARRVAHEFAQIRGGAVVTGTLPLAPTREFAAPILGSVGPATAEIIKESGGTIQEGDVVGLSGLQTRYDEQLRGTAGYDIEAVSRTGAQRNLGRLRPAAGKPLHLTLDRDLQEKAERILGGAPSSYGATALVAIRPSTGDVLAAANGPGTEGLNIATYGQYAPGSTFKLVTSLALLRAGLTPQSPVDCPPSIVVDGKRFENYDDYPSSMLGRITLREAVANSCNTAFIGQADRLGKDDLAEAAAALGLGVDHDTGFPSYFGQVPAATTETEAAADMIGQGKILASPLSMALAAASVRAGHAVLPRLVRGHEAEQTEPARPLTAGEARSLRGLMRAVVTEGSGSGLADLPGDVGAKTGTAEYGEPGPDGSLPTHGWMLATRDDLAVCVFVEHGASGSSTAGPLLEAFLRG